MTVVTLVTVNSVFAAPINPFIWFKLGLAVCKKLLACYLSGGFVN